MMSMEIRYVRPRSTATLRMRERCSNSADLAGFRNQLVLELFVSVLVLKCPKRSKKATVRRDVISHKQIIILW